MKKYSVEEVREKFEIWFLAESKNKYRAMVMITLISTKGNYGMSEINNRWRAYKQAFIDLELLESKGKIDE